MVIKDMFLKIKIIIQVKIIIFIIKFNFYNKFCNFLGSNGNALRRYIY